MGDSKRRKQLDSNYGSLNNINLGNECEDILYLKSTFIVSNFWSDGDAIIETVDIDRLEPNIKYAYDLAFQSSTIDLGLKFKKNRGLGFFQMIEKHFYDEMFSSKCPENASVVTDWHSKETVDFLRKQPTLKYNGKAKVYNLINFLMNNCDREHQFAFLYSGVPSIKDNVSTELVFIADSRKLSDREFNIKVQDDSL